MTIYDESLELHYQIKGKIEVISRLPVKNKKRFIFGVYPGGCATLLGNSKRCR